MKASRQITMIALIIASVPAISVLAQTAVPPHPDELVYPPFSYTIEPASDFREVLPNGMVVFVAEDRMLPTFDMSVMIHTGAAFEPADKAGVASLTGEQIRDGGTQSITPEQLDERIEFLAASMSCSIDDTTGRASLSCLSKDLDESLALFVDMLRFPRFDEDRFRKAVDRRLQNIKRRNDATADIAAIEWGFLMNGEDHFSNRYPSTATLKSISRQDMVAFHNQYFHPGNMIVSVVGDFDRDAMLAKLEQAFGDWPVGTPAPRAYSTPDFEPTPGVYVIHKDGMNQGRVSLGHKGIMRGSPDQYAAHLANGILGAMGFRSRLMAKVRSAEGLAYDVRSSFRQGVYYPGSFQCSVQSKNSACAYAIQLIIDEIERMRTEKVNEEDLQDAINYVVEGFPKQFQFKTTLLSAYMADEYTGRDLNYWPNYVANIKKVTADDILRVAKKYFHPDQLVFLAVGDAKALIAGGHEKAPDVGLGLFGTVMQLPLRDPDTLRR